MGSPKDERGRKGPEGLPRRVVIPERIAIAKFEVTVDQFSAFVAETGMTVSNLCHILVEISGTRGVWGPPEASFRQPGFEVTGTQPVVCISLHEAQSVRDVAAAANRQTLSAADRGRMGICRAGRYEHCLQLRRRAACGYARFADVSFPLGWGGGCRGDTVAYGPRPVGSLKPNSSGLFDMHGNAWEWVEDCWTPIVSEIPTDGSAFSRPGSCEVGVMRGGSWAAGYPNLRSATRGSPRATSRYHHLGFRVALSMDE